MDDPDSLIFMTHAPGAVVPQRADEGPADVHESFVGKMLGIGKKAVGISGGPKNDGGSLGDSAGKEAFSRVREANRRQREAKPKPEVDVNKTLLGASKHIDATPARPGVVTASPVVGGNQDVPYMGESGPSFFGLLPGALLVPLKGLPVTLVHMVIVFMALMLLELSPLLGLIACAMAGAELISLRVRLMHDGCSGRDRVAWPELPEIFTALPPYAAAWMLFLPAVVVAFLAWGSPAFDASTGNSVQQRAARIALKPVEMKDGAIPEGVTLGHNTMVMLESLVASELKPATRTTVEVQKDFKLAVGAAVRGLVTLDEASPAGFAARALALLAFLAFPIAFLAAVRLRSAYAAVYVPLLLRSTLRVPFVYMVVLASFAVEILVILWVTFALGPVLREQLGGTPGHMAWIGGLSLLLVTALMISGALLGRLYRSQQMTLAWD